MLISDIYREAADLLEPPGRWIRGATADGYGHCATGAIAVAAGLNAQDCPGALLPPFVGWLVANRPDEVADAMIHSVFSSNRRNVDRVLCADFNEADLLNVVQVWNDAHIGRRCALPRTQAQVVEALRDFADKWDADNGNLGDSDREE